jgi:histone H3/H4
MKLIAEKNLKSSMKKMGFNSFDSKVHSLVEAALMKYSSHVLTKAAKIAQRTGSSVVEVDHVLQAVSSKKQKGGAETTLPLEYFGVRTNYYSENAPMGTDMSVTDANIRPAFVVNDIQGVIKGGGNKFNVPFTSVKEAISKWQSSQGVQVRSQAQKLVHQKFEMEFNNVLNKASKLEKGDHLGFATLDKVLNQRQYQKLFKQ